MRDSFLRAAPIAHLIGLMAAFGAAGLYAQTPANILINSSFDKPLNEGWNGIWALRDDLALRGKILLTPKYRKSGLMSLSLSPNAKNVSDSSFFDFGMFQRLNANDYRGKPLLFQGWINAEGGATAVIRVVAVGEDGAAVLRTIRKESEPVPNRKLVLREDIFDVPTYPLKELFVYCSVEGTKGSAYFDDVRISIADGNAGMGQTSTESARIAGVSIDAQDIVRRIPDELYGMNIEYAYGFYGTFNQFTGEYNPTTVALTNDLAPTSLRFPGGLFANFYHWKDATGPYENRPLQLLQPRTGYSITTFGTDEAIAFSKLVNAPLDFTVNALTGTPEEAAEWLHYARERGANSKFWEIGNEIYFVNDPTDPQGLFWSPERYVATYREFSKALRAADPEVKLAADIEYNLGMNGCGLSGPTGCWADVILRDLNSDIDYVALHNALAPIMLGQDAGWDVRTVYETLFAAPVQVRSLLNEVNGKLDALGDAGKNIRLAMVEWGPYYQIEPTSRFIDHVKTVASAVYTASMLKTLIEQPRMDIAHGFSLLDPWTQGWIGFRDDEPAPKAPYLAFQLFRKHFGNLLLRSTTQSPTYDSRSIGIVPATTGVPYVDTISSIDEASGQLRIIAVNKNLDQPIQVSFFVRGYNATGPGTAYVLAGASPDSNTGTKIVDSVGEGVYVEQSVYAPNGRFNIGSPEELKIETDYFPVSGSCLSYQLPPHSVVALEVPGYVAQEPVTSDACNAENGSVTVP